MSPVEHIQWKNKFTLVQIPFEMYLEKWRTFWLNVSALPIVPWCSPIYFLSTHIRQRKMNNELSRNDLWPNVQLPHYKGLGMTGP
ncbi:hypothetical protein DIPPA_18946 [Diplonema papillatum]|nr:hypothetical protein DIPPA_18946 [Diplonema papillatum]